MKMKIQMSKYMERNGPAGQCNENNEKLGKLLKDQLIFPLIAKIKSEKDLPVGRESLDYLNDDCLLKVFGYLKCPITLTRLPQISKRFYRIYEDVGVKKKLWGDLIEYKFSYKCEAFHEVDVATMKNTYRMLSRPYDEIKKETINGRTLSSQFRLPFMI